jgi:hypothetical protein
MMRLSGRVNPLEIVVLACLLRFLTLAWLVLLIDNRDVRWALAIGLALYLALLVMKSAQRAQT